MASMDTQTRIKAPYAPPVLVRFGDFTTLTQGYVGNGTERGYSGTAVRKNTPQGH
jgi:hypothetical protein